jgi:hypothetical protein
MSADAGKECMRTAISKGQFWMAMGVMLALGVPGVVWGAENTAGSGALAQPSIFWRNGEWQTYHNGTWGPYQGAKAEAEIAANERSGPERGTGPARQGNRNHHQNLSPAESTGATGLDTVGNIGQTTIGIGQPNGGIGQPNTTMGQTTIGIGQPNHGFGQRNATLGQTTIGIGQPNRGMGAPNTGIGQRTTGIGQPNGSIGQPNMTMGQTTIGIGQPNRGMGAPNTGIAPRPDSSNASEKRKH